MCLHIWLHLSLQQQLSLTYSVALPDVRERLSRWEEVLEIQSDGFSKFDEGDRKLLVMSGMSAAFSAVFGTPLAAAIFPMEMISVGIMHYAALVPCVFSSIVANRFAVNMGINPEAFTIHGIPELTFTSLR